MRTGNGSYLLALTGLRGFAALLVLFLHLNQNFASPFTNRLEPLQRGYLGVDLFFILSGFIIAHVYARQILPVRAKSLRIFLWHRFIRLYPTHVVVLLGLIALVVAARQLGVSLNSQTGWNYKDLPWHFLLLHAWGVTETASWNSPSWSISAECFAYLLFPPVALGVLALPRRIVLPLAAIILLAVFVVFGLAGWDLKSALTGPPALLRVETEFICGVLMFRALEVDGVNWLTPRVADVLAFTGFVGFFVAGFAHAHELVLVLLLALLIFSLAEAGPVGRAVFAGKRIVWLGEISYSIYMVHFPVLLVLHHGAERLGLMPKSAAGQALAWVICTVAVIGCAAIMFYVVENPARRRLRDVFGKIEPAVSGAGPMPAHHGLGHAVGGGEVGLDVDKRRAI